MSRNYEMSRPNSNGGHLFYVVRFIELPFPDVNRYVCVPYSWISSYSTSSTKVVVAYPTDENSLAIRDWVKNRKKPNDEWRFYIATIEYQSDTFEDANNWIETPKDQEPCKIENSKKNKKDSEVEPILNRKLRSASRSFFFGKKSGKPSVSVKPYNNRRKPLPRVSIRLPLQTQLTKNMDIKSVKRDDIANSVSNAINCPLTVSDDIKGKQSIIDSNNQSIKRTQTGSAACLENNTSCEQKLPDIIEGDKSVMPDQSATPKLSQNPPSPASQDSEPEPSLTVTDTGFDEDDHEYDVVDHVTPIKEALYPGKTPANSPEQVPQSEHINETSITLVHNENSLSQQHLQDVPVGQSKAADLNPKTQLRQLLTTLRKKPKPSGAASELSQNRHRQSAFLPPISATHQSSRLQGANGSSITAMTYTHKRPHSKGFIDNSSSSPHYITNMINPCARLPSPSIKEKSLSVTENPISKRICIENITRNSLIRQESSSSTAQHHSFNHSDVNHAPQLVQRRPEEVSRQSTSNAKSNFGVGAIDLRVPQRNTTTSATQNLSCLAQHPHSIVQLSHLQHYSLTQRQYLEQMARLNSRVEQPYVVHSTDRNSYFPNTMNSEFTLQNKPNSTIPTNQLLLQQYSQYGPLGRGSTQEVLRHETPIELIGGTHTNSAAATQNFGSNIRHSAQNFQNQSHHNFNNPQQRQYLVQYQDLPGHSLKSKVNPQTTEYQGVIQRIQSFAPPKSASKPLLDARRSYLLQDPRVQEKLNRNPTGRQILNLVVPGKVVDEAELTTVNAEIQIETPSALLPEIGIVYQNPHTKKLVVDQATEVDHVMDADHCEDEAAESDENTPYVVDCGCQTDAYPVEEQNALNAETDSEPEISTHDKYSDDDECEDYLGTDAVGASRPTSPQNPNIKQRTVPEEELLNMYGTLFTQMGNSFHYTRDLFKHLRNSLIKCAELYESLVKKVEEIKEQDQLQTSTSPPNVVTSRVYNKTISERSNLDKISSIDSRAKIDHPPGGTFVLPPEYDPNNPKWTRKYQMNEPGVIELIPRTQVYVSKKGLQNCQREAKDCRTLARLLLTEVFSRNALSVCSLTGSVAKAFNSLNLEVRPGLDEDARMVLLTFVERYGAKRGWKVDDTSGIISSIRTKILEMRAKYGQVSKD